MVRMYKHWCSLNQLFITSNRYDWAAQVAHFYAAQRLTKLRIGTYCPGTYCTPLLYTM